VFFLPIYARKQAKHNERLVERQMIKAIARQTNNEEHYVDKEKEENLSAYTSKKFALVCMRFLTTT